MFTVYWPGSLAELYGSLRQLPQMLAEDGPYAVRALDAIGRAVAASLRQAFFDKSFGGTDEFGIQWAPLAPFTVEKKGHDAILVDSGQLAADMDPENDFMVETRANEIVVRIVTPYVSFHQTGFTVVTGSPIRLRGTVIGRWKEGPIPVPARPVIPPATMLTSEWWSKILATAMPEIVSAVAEWLQTGGGGGQ